MTLVTDTQDLTQGSHVDPQSLAGRVPDASRAARTTSFSPDDFPVPTGREEEWRFTPVDRLGELFADGTTSGHLDWATELPEGVTLTEISSAR
jgi:Fe-S cluster assembly protein SufD